MTFPRGQASIAGFAYTDLSRDSGRSTFALAAEAITAALDDAGLDMKDVDGLASYSVGDSTPPMYLAQGLGLDQVHYFLDQAGGGSTSQSVVGAAALAVSHGVSECVVVYRALNSRSEFRMGGTGRAPRRMWDSSYKLPYGYFAPVQEYAMAARAHMLQYGSTSEDLGRLAVLHRENARENERAMRREPLTMEEYLTGRWIAEPFRVGDCCLETDGACAVVIVSTERARTLRKPPVRIEAVAWGEGSTLMNGRFSDLATSPSARLAPRLYSAAGIGPREIDVAEIYDCFTFSVLVQLEDYGFCGKGEASAFIASGALDRTTGSIPVNTHGGFLSEGYVHGLNHTCEAVQQLRGDAGTRQVAGAEVALVTGPPGYTSGLTSALVLRAD